MHFVTCNYDKEFNIIYYDSCFVQNTVDVSWCQLECFTELKVTFLLVCFLKATWGQNLTSAFVTFLSILWRKSFLQSFNQASISYKVTKFWFQFKWRHTHKCAKHFTAGFLCFFLVSFMEKKPMKFYRLFVHFIRTYEFAKFWMIKLYLDISGIIHLNEHTKYVNSSLHINFWIFLSFCFIMKKDHFRQKLASGPL